MKYDLDALARKMGVADSQRRFPQTGLKIMWELELLDFQKTGRITGQNHSALGRIMRINNAVLELVRDYSLFLKPDQDYIMDEPYD